MRWLFALFIAVSCWTSSVTGSLLSPTHPPSRVTLSTLDCHYASNAASSVSALSPYLHLEKKSLYSQLRLMGVPVKKIAIKNRLGTTKFTGSANPSLANNAWHGTYLAISRSSRADEIYKQPRQSLPLVKYSDWIFHVSAQQNRVGGWKESNIQYSGMLTYHHFDVMTSLSA